VYADLAVLQTFLASYQLRPEQISTLGWDTEKLIGVDADHSQLTRCPHRGDEESFENLKSTLSTLMKCPETHRPDFVISHDAEEAPEYCAYLAKLDATSKTILSIESGHIYEQSQPIQK